MFIVDLYLAPGPIGVIPHWPSNYRHHEFRGGPDQGWAMAIALCDPGCGVQQDFILIHPVPVYNRCSNVLVNVNWPGIKAQS